MVFEIKRKRGAIDGRFKNERGGIKIIQISTEAPIFDEDNIDGISIFIRIWKSTRRFDNQLNYLNRLKIDFKGTNGMESIFKIFVKRIAVSSQQIRKTM